MGRGDKKSRRGKIFSGSFGKRRRRKKVKHIAVIPEIKKEVPAGIENKAELKKTEQVVVVEKKTKKGKTSKKETQ